MGVPGKKPKRRVKESSNTHTGNSVGVGSGVITAIAGSRNAASRLGSRAADSRGGMRSALSMNGVKKSAEKGRARSFYQTQVSFKNRQICNQHYNHILPTSKSKNPFKKQESPLESERDEEQLLQVNPKFYSFYYMQGATGGAANEGGGTGGGG